MALRFPREAGRLAAVQSVVRTPGLRLEPPVRALMEARFGRDLSQVRVHTDEAAADSASALAARAYTFGSHVMFGAGCYRPDTTQGLWLLAHELAHVIQQEGSRPTVPNGVSDASNPLERAADRAADLVVAGCSLTDRFPFGSAPKGILQCHELPLAGAEPCSGYPFIPDGAALQQADRLLEDAYVAEFAPYDDVIYRGSEWGVNNTVPHSAPNKPFANDLLAVIYAWPPDDRPNIIDFFEREAYFFRRAGITTEPRVGTLISRFHTIAHTIGRQHNEPAWVSTRANWFPDHKLEFPGDPLKRFVCTQATDHMPPRGLILYDIRAERRPQRRSSDFQFEEFERNYLEFGPLVRAQLPERVPVFDPSSPDYVLIVPPEFWQLRIVKEKSNEAWEQLKMKAPIFVDYKQASVSTWHTYLFIMEQLAGAGASGSFVASIRSAQRAVQVIRSIRAAVKAEQVATTANKAKNSIEVIEAFDDAAKATAAMRSAPIQGFTTTQLAKGSGQWAAVQSIGSSKAVQRATTIGLMSGVMIFGNVGIAQAQGSPVTVTPDDVESIKAVPINDFQIMAGVPQTFSAPSWNELRRASAPISKKELGLGREVLYDHKRHWVLGRFKVV